MPSVARRARRSPFPRYVFGPKPKRRTELGLLLFGALGELLAERSGVLNLGLHKKRYLAAGEYTISRLPSHEYTVYFSGPGGLQTEYLSQYYKEKEGGSEAEPVSVTAPRTVSGIELT